MLLETVLDERVLDERAARRDLRAQIARLEARGASAPGGRGPCLLSVGELEAVRDALAATSSGHFGTHTVHNCPLDAHWRRLEAMLADPRAHRWERVTLAELGLPGCGAYRVTPRLGLIGMLAGWWQITLSSGCP
jgi:hypothetical protein